MYRAVRRPPSASGQPFSLDPLEPRTMFSAHHVTAPAGPHHPPAPVAAVRNARDIVTPADRQRLLAQLAPDLRHDLQPLLKANDGAAFDAALLRYMTRRAGPRFFFNPKRLPKSFRLMNRMLPKQVQTKIDRANDVLAHRFPEQVNSDTYTVQLGRAIDYDTQPTSTDAPDFLHSLNRQTYWQDLAMAYRLTDDPAYVRELTNQLVSWSAQTPNLANPDDWPNASPHWWLLDAADRAQNWTATYFMVLGTPGWGPQANTLFLTRLFDHADFLSRVTPGALRSNRTTLHATGLLEIATMFPEFAAAPKWTHQGTQLMFDCLDAQFYPDGGHVEESPAYQASALSAFVDQYQLAQLNESEGHPSPWTRKPRRKLTRAIEAYYQLLSPDGLLPGLSDTYRASNPLPFLTRASFIFDDDRYRLSPPRIEDLLVSPDAIDRAAVPIHTYLPNRGPSYALTDSGYYLLRSREFGSPGDVGSATQVVVDAGPKGGTHGHYDLLSFELTDSTLHTLVADPGPYRYDDSDDRKWVISTPAHNTISVDGLNHAEVEGPHNPAIVVDAFETTADHALFSAHHTAYSDLKGAPVVGRTIWLDRAGRSPLMLVADYGVASATHTFTTSLNLPGDTVTTPEPGVVEDALTKFYTLRVQSLPVAEQTLTTEDRFISSRPPPDAKDPATRIAVSQTGRTALFITLISEYISSGQFAQSPPTAELAEPPAPGKPLKIRLTTPDGATRIVDLPPPGSKF